jgi:hypothetical protein
MFGLSLYCFKSFIIACKSASSPLFETKIGKAKLLFCGFDLDGDYPECKQLLSSITQYVNSDKF